jgi:hypothetical protein
MQLAKSEILKKLCYTVLVYDRINKKLGTHLAKDQIEKKIYQIILESPIESISRKGKNFYIKNQNISITVNSNTYRVITVDTVPG